MHYALFYLFGVVAVGGFGRGKAHTFNGAAQKAGEDKTVRGTRAIRHWLDNARSRRAPQVHAGVVG